MTVRLCPVMENQATVTTAPIWLMANFMQFITFPQIKIQGSKLRPCWSPTLPKFYLYGLKIYFGAFLQVQLIVEV